MSSKEAQRADREEQVKTRYDLRSQVLRSLPGEKPPATHTVTQQKLLGQLLAEHHQHQPSKPLFFVEAPPILELPTSSMDWHMRQQEWQASKALRAKEKKERYKQQRERLLLARIEAKKTQALAEAALKTEAEQEAIKLEDWLAQVTKTWEQENTDKKPVFEQIFDYFADRLPKRFYKLIPATTILTLLLAACSFVSSPAKTEVPGPNQGPVPTEGSGLPDQATEQSPTQAEVELTPTVSVEEFRKLSESIQSELEKELAAASPITQAQFDHSLIQDIANMFAKALTNPENPVLNPKAFFIDFTSDEIPFLELTEDSIFGKKNEVRIFYTGNIDEGMFATTDGAGVTEGGYLANVPGFYVGAFDKTGELVKVVDATKQWVDPSEAQKIAAVDVSKQIAISYVDGKHEIDFNKLSREEYEKLSVAITEELNNRIEAPPHFLENGQVTYLDKKTGEQLTISSTEFNQKKAELAPNSFIPAKQDEDGTWMYLDEESKQYVRIEGSAGFDFSSVVDENNMDAGIINWPTTEKLGNNPHYEGPYPDLTFDQMILKDPYNGLYIPVVLVNNQATSIPAQSSDNGNFTYTKGLEFLVKRAYGFEKIYIIFTAYKINFREEDSSKEKNILYRSDTDGAKALIKEELTENQIYFLGFLNNQVDSFKSANKITIDNIGGAVPAKDSVTALTNDQSQENKLIIAIANILIKHK